MRETTLSRARTSHSLSATMITGTAGSFRQGSTSSAPTISIRLFVV
ncbi:MAG: hypothetical protein JNL61_04470 [Rhizobiaceae bacterium]|nr:hypothetical protein [Rhizobiaceae bacterium]